MLLFCLSGLVWLPVVFAAYSWGRRRVTLKSVLLLIAGEFILLASNAARYVWLMRDFH